MTRIDPAEAQAGDVISYVHPTERQMTELLKGILLVAAVKYLSNFDLGWWVWRDIRRREDLAELYDGGADGLLERAAAEFG